MTTRVVIYPIFAECSGYTLDPYWKGIFEKCSRNKFPKGCSYDAKNHVIYVKNSSSKAKNMREIINLPSSKNAASEIFEVMMNIFRKNLNLRSIRDLNKSRRNLQDAKDSIELDLSEWKKIKPRSLRDILIMRYVAKIQTSKTLSNSAANDLYRVIKMGLQFNKIQSKDIDYRNGSIQSIDGLEYNENTQKFVVMKEINYKSKTEKKKPTKNFDQAVNLFIKDSRTKRLKL